MDWTENNNVFCCTVQTTNKKRQSALQLASLNGHENVVEFLQTLEPVLQVVQLQGWYGWLVKQCQCFPH